MQQHLVTWWHSRRQNVQRGHWSVQWLVVGIWVSVVFLLGSPGCVDAEDEHFLLRNDGRLRGEVNAPVTLVEYSDFTCGFCEKFFQQTWPRLFTEYVQTGKVRFVYRDFPRGLIGAGVETALTARCAGEQGQYWTMHDRLFATRNKYEADQLQKHAEVIGLDLDQFGQCYQSRRYLEVVLQDQEEGGSLGIRGTPGFVLFLTRNMEDGLIVVIPGAFPFAVFKEQIDQLLEEARL